MESLKEKVKNFIQTADEVKKWQEIKKSLFTPHLDDTTLIPVVYDWVCEICEENENINTFKYDSKHYFLLCVIFLYSPRTMVEENMNEGIRDVVASVLGISESPMKSYMVSSEKSDLFQNLTSDKDLHLILPVKHISSRNIIHSA
ncbi:MAG: hypothetical protein ACK5MK_08240 [Dysgonomonas sp.]